MAASRVMNSCLNKRLLYALKHPGTTWQFCRYLDDSVKGRFPSVIEDYKDRLPKHEEQNDAEAVDHGPGQWKIYTRKEYWEINGRRTDKDVFDGDVVMQILKKMELEYKTENDMPVENLPDPYQKAPRRCILCQYNIQFDHKNTQLLSQFISPYTGRIYGRHITGLCIHMQKRVSKLIVRSRRLGFLPAMFKKPEFLNDPELYDPFSRKKVPFGE